MKCKFGHKEPVAYCAACDGLCKKCGAILMGNEEFGETCNACLDKAVKRARAAEEAL